MGTFKTSQEECARSSGENQGLTYMISSINYLLSTSTKRKSPRRKYPAAVRVASATIVVEKSDDREERCNRADAERVSFRRRGVARSE
jgi:hypothetical protein